MSREAKRRLLDRGRGREDLGRRLGGVTAAALVGTLGKRYVFELFANYCVVSDGYDEEFDVNEVHTGGGEDLGLDGIAIIVNGVLVTSVEEVADLLEVNGYLDVSFMFVQAKSGGNFSSEQIAILFDGVDEFFADNPTLAMNDKVTNARSVMLAIYDNSVKFHLAKPSCRVSLVTTGQWTDDLARLHATIWPMRASSRRIPSTWRR